MSSRRKLEQPEPIYTACIHSLSHPETKDLAIGCVIFAEDGAIVQEISRRIGKGEREVADFIALEAALRSALARNVKRLEVLSDSQDLVDQFNGKLKVRNLSALAPYARAKAFARHLELTVSYVRPEKNRHAIGLARKVFHQEEASKRQLQARQVTISVEGGVIIANGKWRVNLGENRCECPDFRLRAQHLGIDCKHLIAAKQKLGA